MPTSCSADAGPHQPRRVRPAPTAAMAPSTGVPGAASRSASSVIARSEPYRSSRSASRASACQRSPRSSALTEVSARSMPRCSDSRVVQLRHLPRLPRLAVALGQLRELDDVEQPVAVHQRRRPHGAVRGDPGRAQLRRVSARRRRAPGRAAAPAAGPAARAPSRRTAWSRPDGQRLRPVGEQPARRPVEQAPRLQHDGVGDRRRDLRARAAPPTAAGRSNTAVVTA